MNTGEWINRVKTVTTGAISDIENAADEFVEWAQWAKRELARQKRAEKSMKPSVIVKAPPADDVGEVVSSRPTRNASKAAINNIRKHTLCPLNRKLRRPGSDEQDDAGYLSGVSSGRSTVSSKTSTAPEDVFTKPKPVARKRGRKAEEPRPPPEPASPPAQVVDDSPASPETKTPQLEHIPHERVLPPPVTPRSVKETIKQFEEMNRNSQDDAKRSVIVRNVTQVFPTQEKTLPAASPATMKTNTTPSPLSTAAEVSPAADRTTNLSRKAPEADGTLPKVEISAQNESVPQETGEGTFIVNISSKTVSLRIAQSSQNGSLGDSTYNVPRQTRSGSKSTADGTFVKTPTVEQASLTRSGSKGSVADGTYVKTPTLEQASLSGFKGSAADGTCVKTPTLQTSLSNSSETLSEPRRTRSRDATMTKTPQMDVAERISGAKTVIKRTVQEYKESTPRLVEVSGFVLNETSPAFSPVPCSTQNVINETDDEEDVPNDDEIRSSVRRDSKLDKSIGGSGEKIGSDDEVPVCESSRIISRDSPKAVPVIIEENRTRITRQKKVTSDVHSQGDSSYVTAERSVTFEDGKSDKSSRNVTNENVQTAVKRTKTRKAKKEADIFETSTEPEMVEKPRIKRTRTRKAKAETSELFETADETFERPVKRTKRKKKRTKTISRKMSYSVDEDVSEFTDSERTRVRTPDQRTRSSSKRSADMAEIFGNAPAETVLRKKHRREEDTEFLAPALPPPLAKPAKVAKVYDAGGNAIPAEIRSTRTKTLKAPSVDQTLPDASAAEGRPVRTRTKVRRFGDDDATTDQSEAETNTSQRVTRTRTKARLAEIDTNKPNPVPVSRISRKSKGRRNSKVLNQILLKKLQMSEKKMKTPLSAIGKMHAIQHATVLKENQLSVKKKEIAKVVVRPTVNDDEKREAKFKTKQHKEELAALKKQEELKRKRELIKLKNEEKSQRAMQNRAKIEESRQAKLREMELEQQRILQEKQRQQEMEEKRAKERQEEKRKLLEMERIAKAKAAQARAEAERKLAELPSSTYEGIYLPKNENDLGLEEELSEGSDGEEPPSPKKAPSSWVAAVKRGVPVQKFISLEQMALFMPILSKTPNVHKMFNLSPRKLKRTSSAIWNATLSTPEIKRI